MKLLPRVSTTERYYDLCGLGQSPAAPRRRDEHGNIQQLAEISSSGSLLCTPSRYCIPDHELGHRKVCELNQRLFQASGHLQLTFASCQERILQLEEGSPRDGDGSGIRRHSSITLGGVCVQPSTLSCRGFGIEAWLSRSVCT